MKLLSVNVKNFGTLENYSVNFSDGLNTIKEENGFGKSTLAAFIKAMFYSFLGSNHQSLKDNERKKYSPWQQGAFGGSLDFEAGGRKYRIERFFGARPKDDTFRLLDLDKGTESNDFSENIGEELFGINAEGLEKSVYMPQMQLDLSMTTSLSAKLTGLLEDSNDLGNFDDAIKKLNTRRTYYAAQRGNKGFIADLESKYSETERKIGEAKNANETLLKLEELKSDCAANNNELSIKLDALRKQIAAAASNDAIIAENKRRDEITAEISAIESSINQLNNKYKNGFPEEAKVDEISNRAYAFDGIMSKIKVLEAQTADAVKLDSLKQKYSANLSVDELIKIKESLNEIAVCKAALQGVSPNLNNKKSKLPIIMLILAAALVGVGVAGIFYSLILGIILLVLGFIAAMAGGFLLLKGMIAGSGISSSEAKEYAKNSAKTALMEQEIEARLEALSLNPQISLKELEAVIYEAREIERLSSEEKARLAEIKTNKSAADCEKNLIDEFFISVLGETVLKTVEVIQNIKNDKSTLLKLNDELNSKREKLEAIPKNEAVVSVSEKSREELINEEKQVLKEIDELSNRISEYDARISSYEAIALELPDLQAELEAIKSEIDTSNERLFAIDKAIELLKQAKTNLSSRYLTVMRDRMKEYSKLVYGEDVGEMLLDDSLSLELSREGAARDKDYFSSGYKDMLNICMRLSLADALYDGEAPMLILDDPFVNLDDTRLTNAMELLKKLAEGRQIIYLTCHSSRVL